MWIKQISFTFIHSADVLIQSDLKCIQGINFSSICVPWESNVDFGFASATGHFCDISLCILMLTDVKVRSNWLVLTVCMGKSCGALEG